MPIAHTSTLQSAGPLLIAADAAPGGDVVLFAADVAAATIHAFELPAGTATAASNTIRIDRLGAKLASLVGVDPDDVVIRGIAAHPVSHDVYLSIARGRGAEAAAVVVRATADGELEIVDLERLPVASFVLDDAPRDEDDRRDFWLDGRDEGSAPREINGVVLDVVQVPVARSTITGLAWAGGRLIVAGLSNEEFSSRLRQIDYPFDGAAVETSVEIFHVDHGRYETGSPIRALTPFDSGRSVLATYTCTPVVSFTVDELHQGGFVRGRTVAELGPMNQPFSIVSYERDGEEFLLVSNTRHPLLKIPAATIASQPHLDVPASVDGASRGVPRESLDHPGVTWMASLDRDSVVVVQKIDGEVHLRTLRAEEL